MAISPSAAWADSNTWFGLRRTPFIAVLAGVDQSKIVDAALDDPALIEAASFRLEPAFAPPCDVLLWRVENAFGASLNDQGLLNDYWHRSPYAMTVRLVQYEPGSTVPQILDEGTLGTRGSRAAFKASLDRLVMRFVRDAILGRGRGPDGSVPVTAPHGLPGWLDYIRGRWRDRLMVEWWSVGTATTPLEDVLSGTGLDEVTWYRPKAEQRYLADPFPWPGTDRILCEEMPLTDGVGRIVYVTETSGTLEVPAVVLEDGFHHSYPCTFLEDGVVFCVPESTKRGATCIFRLEDNGCLVLACEVAPHFRLADPTLFKWQGQFWLACTDLDLGEHDNLCLLHASTLAGPWIPHARWPVKIDIRSSRPAGMVYNNNGRLFRPAQDCAATYGAAVALLEIVTLNETEFQETLVSVLRPDPAGPFPHGLHTLVHDGERFWLDGKRFILDVGALRRKLMSKIHRMLFENGVD